MSQTMSYVLLLERDHDHGNCYKGKHLSGTDLEFQRLHPLLLCKKACQHADRHGDGEVDETSTSRSSDKRKRETLGLVSGFLISKLHP